MIPHKKTVSYFPLLINHFSPITSTVILSQEIASILFFMKLQARSHNELIKSNLSHLFLLILMIKTFYAGAILEQTKCVEF